MKSSSNLRHSIYLDQEHIIESANNVNQIFGKPSQVLKSPRDAGNEDLETQTMRETLNLNFQGMEEIKKKLESSILNTKNSYYKPKKRNRSYFDDSHRKQILSQKNSEIRRTETMKRGTAPWNKMNSVPGGDNKNLQFKWGFSNRSSGTPFIRVETNMVKSNMVKSNSRNSHRKTPLQRFLETESMKIPKWNGQKFVNSSNKDALNLGNTYREDKPNDLLSDVKKSRVQVKLEKMEVYLDSYKEFRNEIEIEIETSKNNQIEPQFEDDSKASIKYLVANNYMNDDESQLDIDNQQILKDLEGGETFKKKPSSSVNKEEDSPFSDIQSGSGDLIQNDVDDLAEMNFIDGPNEQYQDEARQPGDLVIDQPSNSSSMKFTPEEQPLPSKITYITSAFQQSNFLNAIRDFSPYMGVRQNLLSLKACSLFDKNKLIEHELLDVLCETKKVVTRTSWEISLILTFVPKQPNMIISTRLLTFDAVEAFPDFINEFAFDNPVGQSFSVKMIGVFKPINFPKIQLNLYQSGSRMQMSKLELPLPFTINKFVTHRKISEQNMITYIQNSEEFSSFEFPLDEDYLVRASDLVEILPGAVVFDERLFCMFLDFGADTLAAVKLEILEKMVVRVTLYSHQSNLIFHDYLSWFLWMFKK